MPSSTSNYFRKRAQNREIKEMGLEEKETLSGQFSDNVDLSKVHLSIKEYNTLRIKDRYSAREVANKIRFKMENNFSDRLDLKLTPYLFNVIDCMGKKGIYWIICIAPTQSGKTTALQIFLADHIDQKGGNFFYIMPTGKTAIRACNDKVVDMIKCTPELYQHIIHPENENITSFVIRLNNASIFPITCGSLAEMSGMTVSGIVIDEVRLMPLDVGNESNVVQQSEDRMTVKLEDGLAQGMMVSSPSREEDLLHKQTTREHTVVLHWYTHCFHCNKMQRLNFWVNMFEKDLPIKECKCKFCKESFDDSDNKKEMNKNGKYGVEGLDGLELDFFPEPEYSRHTVFWWNSLNSPFRSFENIYLKYISVKDKPEDLKNFLISWLAEFQKNIVSTSTVETLKERISKDIHYKEVPSWTKVLTAGIDTQDTGYYFVVEAHGGMRKSVIIDYGFIEAPIKSIPSKTIRKMMREYFEDKIYYTKNRKEWAIAIYPADAGGHRTKEWYEIAFGFEKSSEKLEKLTLCLGRSNVDEIKQSTKKEVYFVNTLTFLNDTEDLYESPDFYIYKGEESEHLSFFNQLLNYRKVKEINKKTGAEMFYWKKYGQFDYRMAHVHSQAALSFRIKGLGKRRLIDLLDDEDFSYNPILRIRQKKAPIVINEPKKRTYEPDKNDIPEFTNNGVIM